MLTEIYHYQRLSQQLSSSDMPTIRQLKAIAEAGVELVINLAPHHVPNAIPNETQLAASLGMQYIDIPVNWNTLEDGLKSFMDVMDANSEKKIHVHCVANFRASAFITMYRILRLGWEPDKAFEAMHNTWDKHTYPVWKMFAGDVMK
ncbi:MAG TPA: protein tyrosine phosphatase family protein [Anaerolineales bacterium]|nr:protein tyrosine phosphatase family protein [Anaerolineales bacterium]